MHEKHDAQHRIHYTNGLNETYIVYTLHPWREGRKVIQDFLDYPIVEEPHYLLLYITHTCRSILR